MALDERCLDKPLTRHGFASFSRLCKAKNYIDLCRQDMPQEGLQDVLQQPAGNDMLVDPLPEGLRNTPVPKVLIQELCPEGPPEDEQLEKEVLQHVPYSKSLRQPRACW